MNSKVFFVSWLVISLMFIWGLGDEFLRPPQYLLQFVPWPHDVAQAWGASMAFSLFAFIPACIVAAVISFLIRRSGE